MVLAGKPPVIQADPTQLVARIILPVKDDLVRGDVPVFGKACGRDFKRYKVECINYNNSEYNVLLSTSCETREEADEIYNQLLELNGETNVENIIDKRTFKK